MLSGGLTSVLEQLSGSWLKSKKVRLILMVLFYFFVGWSGVFSVAMVVVPIYGYFGNPASAGWIDHFHVNMAVSGFLGATQGVISTLFWIWLLGIFYMTLPICIPLIVIGLFMWLVLYLVGGFALLTAGPFIIISSLKALFYHYAYRSLAAADQREEEKKVVKAALFGRKGAPARTVDGKAKLMKREEITTDSTKGAPFYIGKWAETLQTAQKVFTEKHVLIVAGTRGGKGRDLIIPNLRAYQGSVFVLDPKGENAQQTFERRGEFGAARVLDPFGVSGVPTSRYNPLRYLSGESAITDAQTLADALIVGEDYFASSAVQLLTGLILYVALEPAPLDPETGQFLARDLPTVRRLLMRDLDKTLERMAESKAEPAAVRALLVDIASWAVSTSEREWSSIRNTAVEQTKWMNAPEMARVMEESDGSGQIDFSDYLNGVMSVYVCLPAPYFATFNRWLRLVVAAALDTMTKRLAPPPLPVRFVLDELAQLGNLAKVESALTLSAGYGVQLWGIWQHLKDIERCYPRSGVAGWVSSSGVRCVFAVQDNETIRYFAQATEGAMSEADLRQLPPDKLLCLLDGQNPLVIGRLIGPA